jgi:hypothetical protein
MLTDRLAERLVCVDGFKVTASLEQDLSLREIRSRSAEMEASCNILRGIGLVMYTGIHVTADAQMANQEYDHTERRLTVRLYNVQAGNPPTVVNHATLVWNGAEVERTKIRMVPSFDARFPVLAQRLATFGGDSLDTIIRRLREHAGNAASARRVKLFDLDIDGRYAVSLLATVIAIAMLALAAYLLEVAALLDNVNEDQRLALRAVWIGFHANPMHGLIVCSLILAPITMVVSVFQVAGPTWYVVATTVVSFGLAACLVSLLYGTRRAFAQADKRDDVMLADC